MVGSPVAQHAGKAPGAAGTFAFGKSGAGKAELDLELQKMSVGKTWASRLPRFCNCPVWVWLSP